MCNTQATNLRNQFSVPGVRVPGKYSWCSAQVGKHSSLCNKWKIWRLWKVTKIVKRRGRQIHGGQKPSTTSREGHKGSPFCWTGVKRCFLFLQPVLVWKRSKSERILWNIRNICRKCSRSKLPFLHSFLVRLSSRIGTFTWNQACETQACDMDRLVTPCMHGSTLKEVRVRESMTQSSMGKMYCQGPKMPKAGSKQRFQMGRKLLGVSLTWKDRVSFSFTTSFYPPEQCHTMKLW